MEGAGRSRADGLKGGTISTVLINNTEGASGSQHYSEAMQIKWRSPCGMGGTKGRATEARQQSEYIG